MTQLLIATHNKGKFQEIRVILAGLSAELVTLDDIGISEDAPETGATFTENARLKASAYARMSGLPTLADDSGLEVDALAGAPGVYTARFGGAGLTFPERWGLLLDRLRDVPRERRTARFRCAVAVAWPGGETRLAEGTCEGEIAFAPAGSGGFGYDPIFFLREYNCTMAELAEEVKNRISHRARALQAARGLIAEALSR